MTKRIRECNTLRKLADLAYATHGLIANLLEEGRRKEGHFDCIVSE